MNIIFAVILTLISRPALGGEAVSIPNTQVRTLHSKSVGADYKIYISLPVNYAKSARKFPVIYVLDGDYFFSVVRDIMVNLADHHEIEEVIIVGVTYPGVAEDRHGPIFELGRTRDFTPTHVATGGYGPEYQKVSGGSGHFFDFLETELFPMVEGSYQADKSDRTIVGISYGGLASSNLLVSRPELFHRYLIVSPSLWWDKRYTMNLEKRVNLARKDLPAKVFLSAGSLEQGEAADMPVDVTNFAQQLESHHFPSFRGKVWIAPGETHHTVFHVAAVHGLIYLFGDSKPH